MKVLRNSLSSFINFDANANAKANANANANINVISTANTNPDVDVDPNRLSFVPEKIGGEEDISYRCPIPHCSLGFGTLKNVIMHALRHQNLFSGIKGTVSKCLASVLLLQWASSIDIHEDCMSDNPRPEWKIDAEFWKKFQKLVIFKLSRDDAEKLKLKETNPKPAPDVERDVLLEDQDVFGIESMLFGDEEALGDLFMQQIHENHEMEESFSVFSHAFSAALGAVKIFRDDQRPGQMIKEESGSGIGAAAILPSKSDVLTADEKKRHVVGDVKPSTSLSVIKYPIPELPKNSSKTSADLLLSGKMILEQLIDSGFRLPHCQQRMNIEDIELTELLKSSPSIRGRGRRLQKRKWKEAPDLLNVKVVKKRKVAVVPKKELIDIKVEKVDLKAEPMTEETLKEMIKVEGPIFYSHEFIMEGGLKNKRPTAGYSSERYHCPVPDCGKHYKNANGLKYHAQYGHCLPQCFMCTQPQCGKQYTTRNGLAAHLKTHGGRKSLNKSPMTGRAAKKAKGRNRKDSETEFETGSVPLDMKKDDKNVKVSEDVNLSIIPTEKITDVGTTSRDTMKFSTFLPITPPAHRHFHSGHIKMEITDEDILHGQNSQTSNSYSQPGYCSINTPQPETRAFKMEDCHQNSSMPFLETPIGISLLSDEIFEDSNDNDSFLTKDRMMSPEMPKLEIVADSPTKMFPIDISRLDFSDLTPLQMQTEYASPCSSLSASQIYFRNRAEQDSVNSLYFMPSSVPKPSESPSGF